MRIALSIFCIVISTLAYPQTPSPDAAAIVKAAIDHWRGTSSYSEMTMTIHRPDWERTMSMLAWTLGEKKSLVRVVSPKQDAGNSTLLLDRQMWTFSPKINRIVKIPSSMMSQSWLGSDFSNKDIARADDIVHQYVHTLLAPETHDGHVVHVIESIPKEEAAVVWGKEVVKVRDDHVLISHAFYDQDMRLVKQMDTLKIEVMGGRTVASWQRMRKLEETDEWTEVKLSSAKFDIDIPERVFTLSNLRNPR
jgi:outer membrane lipoprotein-sorting protein